MEITQIELDRARAVLLPPASIASLPHCLAAVDRLGFVWGFTPGNKLLPALFPALDTDSDGQRWDWMWGWKDQLAASRAAYYGKIVGRRPTLVSREWLPIFYALTGNTGDLDDDLIQFAERGRPNDLALKIHRYIREFGPTGTRTLQGKLTDGSGPMKMALEKAMEQLDTAMLIVKSGTEGRHSIANVWELFPRFHPEAVDSGTGISTREAATRLIRQFFQLTPAVSVRQLAAVFPWNEGHQERAIARLRETGELVPCTLDGKSALMRANFVPPPA